MKRITLAKFAVAFTACLTVSLTSAAQEDGCAKTSIMGRMARATSPAELKARKQEAGDEYRAQLIYAARMLEIDPTNKAAATILLDMIPEGSDDPHEEVWLELDELPECPSGQVSQKDLEALDSLQYHLPRLITRAVLLVPDKMPEYISHAMLGLGPNNDFAVQARKVCKVRHSEFVSAIGKLSPRDKDWFIHKVFNPEGCKTIYFPEQ